MDQVYGYVRVSTKEQNEARQIAAMREVGVAPGNAIKLTKNRLNGKSP